MPALKIPLSSALATTSMLLFWKWGRVPMMMKVNQCEQQQSWEDAGSLAEK
jgi:hypothetical protein